MKRDTKLSAILHLLLHMSDAATPMTSEQMANAMGSNAVVVRRIMAGLKRAGLVRSEKGHGGGWTLQEPLAAITLASVYEALGSPPLLAIGHRREQPKCLVELSVNEHLFEAFAAAEKTLLEQMKSITLSEIAQDFKQKLRKRGLEQGATSCATMPPLSAEASPV